MPVRILLAHNREKFSFMKISRLVDLDLDETAHGFPLALSHLAYFTTYLRHNVLGLMLKMKRKTRVRVTSVGMCALQGMKIVFF